MGVGTSVTGLAMLGEQLGVIARASSAQALALAIRGNLRWVLPVGSTALLVRDREQWADAASGCAVAPSEAVLEVARTRSGRTVSPDAHPECRGSEWYVQPLVDGDCLLGLLLVSQSETVRMHQDEHALFQLYALGVGGALNKLLLLHWERIATRTAEQAIATRDQVLSSVVHDLLNPIAAVRLTAEMMGVDEAEGLSTPEQRQQDLDTICTRCDDVTGMVREMLDVARIQAGATVTLKADATDLTALVRDAVSSTAVRAHQAVVVDVPQDALVRTVDSARLKRVVVNLIDNASKYSPGPGTLYVSLAETEDVSISVRDYGIGIPEADLATLFERFQRVSNVGDIPGTGVGLATCAEIVRLHGGTLGVASVQGVGSTFTVHLPAP